MTAYSRIAHIRRPRLLLSAARFGLADYDRETNLPRLLGRTQPLGASCFLATLIDLEAEQNDARLARKADYSVARHVDILIALLAEPGAMAPESAHPVS